VQAVKLIEAPKPEYPPSAREARIQGVVRFNVEIGESGTVKNVSLVSGHPLLVPPAVKAVQRYIYQPSLLNGTPVEVVTVVDVDFRLGDLP
jgi:protein TonB